jgi:glucokinase
MLVDAVLALDISGSRTLMARLDPSSGFGPVREVPNRHGVADDYWPAVLEAAEETAGGVPLVGVGVSFGGPVDNQGNVVSMHVPGWAGVDVAGGLAQRLGSRVVVENDANCGALGEAFHGAWGRPHTLVFMTCSTGIGAGVVSGGRLFKGGRGLAGEVGHITLDPEGPLCGCSSRGCFELLCSGSAIRRRGSEAAGRELAGAKDVFDAAAAGETWAQATLDAVFADFGRGLAMVQHAFDPELIVIGGGVSLAGRALTEPAAAAAQPWLMSARRTHLRLETASLGLYAQLWGAVSLITGEEC